MTVYKLLATEKDVNMAQMMPSVTLCTFYKSGETGETTEAEDQAAAVVQAATIANLKLKMSEILEKNDWLMGRIKKEPEAAEIFLEVEKTSTDQCDPNNYIKTLESDDIFAHKTMSEIREHLAPFQIGVGATLIGVEEGKLASFGLIEGADSKNLCVFISVSHLIADGGTVYQLYKMLDEGEQVVSLDRKSVEFMDYAKNETGMLTDSDDHFKSNMTRVFTEVFPAMQTAATIRKDSGRSPQCLMVKMDGAKINAKKELYKGGEVEFVSTNDVVVSWLKTLCPVADSIDMIMTFRDRVPGVTRNSAGNYVVPVTLSNADLSTPADVRKFVNARKIAKNHWSYPSSDVLKQFVGGMSTNWATFYHHLELKGFKHQMHMPVPPEMTMKMGNLELCSDLIECVFGMGKNQETDEIEIGVLILSAREDVSSADILGSDLVEGEIMPYK